MAERLVVGGPADGEGPGIPAAVRRLVARERIESLRVEGPVTSSLPTGDPAGPSRFEGVYGGVYDRVIQTPWLRRAVFGAWGSATVLSDLEGFVGAAAASVADTEGAVLVDVPCGGGTLLPMLERERFRGTAVEVDLAGSMLARAVTVHASLRPGFETVFLRSDALDLPLRDGVADVVVSVNGLHVMPEPHRFLAEIARVTRPGGGLWLITPASGPGVRSRTILAAARVLGITPQAPPTPQEVRELLGLAGFDEAWDAGGRSIVGLAARRRAP